MNIVAIKTPIIHAGKQSIQDVIADAIDKVQEGSVVVISSKIVALCQNRVVDKSSITKPELVQREADYYTPDSYNKYGINFSILNNTFIPDAGIDESNVDNCFVLWPDNPQQEANRIREFLVNKYQIKQVGVIITDSTCMPSMRSGTIGIMIAHSGFEAVKDLIGTKDLFGREFKVSRSSIGGGLAAAANVLMGEGSEQTPIAVISDVPFVKFTESNPSEAEIKSIYIDPELDLYSPFIMSAPWIKNSK